MAIFTINQEAQVIDAPYELATYGAQSAAGCRVRIICKSILDDEEGYEVEHIDKYGFISTYFIKTIHLAPVSLKNIDTKIPKWQRVANEWQTKLWKEKG